jgi:DNA polymerase-3 subunit alpha
MVYQEQVMRIVRDLGGYSFGRSDLVRRAMAKKKMKVMEEERINFVKGAMERDVDEKSANKIYDEMIDFAKYAFNKSHSAAYSYLAYQTAWLKVYYPVEFMSALLTSVMGSSDNIYQYIREAKRLGIEVLPPDINESGARFTPENGKIRFGMVAIKNVGSGAIEKPARLFESGGPGLGQQAHRGKPDQGGRPGQPSYAQVPDAGHL